MRPWLLSLAVLAVGLVTTGLAWRQALQQQQSTQRAQFLAAAEQAVANIDHQLQHYHMVMRGMQGFFQGAENIDYDSFRTYVSSLQLQSPGGLAGVVGVAYAVFLERQDLRLHLDRMRLELPVDYQIRSEGDPDELAPIIYIEPLSDANASAVGFDILTNPAARRAVESARDSGEIVLSGPLALVQDMDALDVPAFVMYLPVYALPERDNPEARRAALLGWVDLPVRVPDFMESLASKIPAHLDIDLFDHDENGGQFLLYRSDDIAAEIRRQAGEWQTEHEVGIGERRWTVRLSSTPEFRAALAPPGQPWLLPAAGGSLSLALALLVLGIGQGQRRSARLAELRHQLYQALSTANQAIVRLESEDVLYPLLCQTAVSVGAMQGACVIAPQPDGSGFRILACQGQGAEAFVDAPDLDGQQEVIINDLGAKPAHSPWAEHARRQGWQSFAAFPLRRQGEYCALLCVWHRRRAAFTAEVSALLREMSADVSFGLDNFEREARRRDSERALAESEARLSTIMDNVGACIYLKDQDGRYLFVNQQILDILGLPREQVIGASDEDFYDAETAARLRAADQRVLQGGEVVQQEELGALKGSDQTICFWSVKLPLRAEDGSVQALCGISTDITERKTSAARIHYLSYYDPLTGLPNKALLEEHLRVALSAARGSAGATALLYLDIDRFKLINDSLGQGAGDQVLRELAERLTPALPADALLARSGGDEFLLLLPNCDAAEASTLAKRLLDLIALPLQRQTRPLALSASIGLAVAPQHGSDAARLVQAAGAALMLAKEQGRNNCQIYQDCLRTEASAALQLESELRQALRKGELSLHYQPQADLQDGRITGVEALLRWQHPRMGAVPPERFIPVAEVCGLMHEIGAWVLHSALCQFGDWRRQGLPLRSLAVNISANQFHAEGFCDSIAALLREHGLTPGLLELELTESVALHHSARTHDLLDRLNALGITLTIDDFGTGYSSFGYLKRYPIRKLKIDRSFIQGIEQQGEDRAIVDSIIRLAAGLGLRTVAEGVESPRQRDLLRAVGCDEIQGYVLSPPVPAEQLPSVVLAYDAQAAQQTE